MFATLILLIAVSEPGRCDKITRKMVLSIRRMMVIKELMGLTSVAMLGKIGVLREGVVLVDR